MSGEVREPLQGTKGASRRGPGRKGSKEGSGSSVAVRLDLPHTGEAGVGRAPGIG